MKNRQTDGWADERTEGKTQEEGGEAERQRRGKDHRDHKAALLAFHQPIYKRIYLVFADFIQ